jgi:hypothetical protein
MGVSGQHHAPAVLYPGIHWIGDWAGLRAGLDAGRMVIKLSVVITKEYQTQKFIQHSSIQVNSRGRQSYWR